MKINDVDFVSAWDKMTKSVHSNAVDKGFWDEPRSTGELIALMHSELSEALESARWGNPPDEHLPYRNQMEVELADCVIRIMDAARGLNFDVGGAIVDKALFNQTRARKHGKMF